MIFFNTYPITYPYEKDEIPARIKAKRIKREILQEIPELVDNSVSDFEKTCLLRDWAYGHLMYAGDSETYTYTDYCGSFSAVANFVSLSEAYQEYMGGGYCDGCAFYLTGLYALFGYNSANLALKVDDECSHATTLVKLPDGRWIIQDATFNMTYVDEVGEPIIIQDLIAMLKSENTDGYRHQFGETRLRYTVFSHEWQGETADVAYPPETLDYYPIDSAPPIIYEGRYAYLQDMRQPSAFERQIKTALEETLIPMGYPPLLDYLYLFPIAINVSNSNNSGELFQELQRLVAG